MGSSGTKSNTLSKTEANHEIVQNNQTTRNNLNNMRQTRQNESVIKDFTNPFSELKPDLSKKLSKEIFRLSVKTNEKEIIGTGFILAFPIDLEWFYCLMTNDHVINNESINNNNIIYITFEEIKAANIKLDRNKRYIKSFKDKELDLQ